MQLKWPPSAGAEFLCLPVTKEEIPFYLSCGHASFMLPLILWLLHLFGICFFSFFSWVPCQDDMGLDSTERGLPHTVVSGGLDFLFSR